MANTTIKTRRGYSTSLEILNPILAAGEFCYETDTNLLKIGDGVTPYQGLPHIKVSGESVVGRIDGGVVQIVNNLFYAGSTNSGIAADGRVTQVTPLAKTTTFGDSVTVTAIGAGNTWSCVIINGALYTWGTGTDGRHGHGTTTAIYSPTRIGTDSDWTAVSAGLLHTLAIKNGALYAWGDNNSGTVGNGVASSTDVTAPVQIGSFTDWTHVAAGGSNSAAIRAGRLYVWGAGTNGQGGNGTTPSTITTPTQVGTDTGWTAVSVGGSYILAIKNGELFSWGLATSGRLGNGASSGQVATPTKVGALSNWTHVAAGYTCGYGICSGVLYGWGSNINYSLGTGTLTAVLAPVQIGLMTNWTYVAGGNGCVVGVAGGRLYGLGVNTQGQLGLGDVVTRRAVTQIGEETDWTMASIGTPTSSTGNAHLLAVRAGKVYGAGENSLGQAGQNFVLEYSTFTLMPVSYNWTMLAVPHTNIMADTYVIGVADGKLYAWGQPSWQNLGDGQNQRRFTPTRIGYLDDWTYAAVTGEANYAAKYAIRAGYLYSWGDNDWAQLGLGQTQYATGLDVATPTQVGTLTGWTAVAARIYMTAGIRNGDLYLWGQDFAAGPVFSPTQYGESGGWTAVTAETISPQKLYGIRNGLLYSIEYDAVITQVAGSGSGWTSISAARGVVVGIRNGGLYVFGANAASYGGLGAATTTPTQIGSDTDWSFAAAGYTSCAAIRAGRLYVVGVNTNKNLGTGDSTNLTTWTQIGTDTSWAAAYPTVVGTFALKKLGNQ
jgi:alpha-tubulin suppressor-like RCC1 family protein